jgi:predicted O-methyltransferase YrrM
MPKTLAQRLPKAYRLYRFFKQAEQIEPIIDSPFIRFSPPGHFYSPIPNAQDLKRVEHAENKILTSDIHLNESEQLELLHQFSAYYSELPFAETPAASSSHADRYYYRNDFFCHGDAIALYSMLRHFRPQRVIEVGSGFSSAVMLDTNDRFLNSATQFTFIEPYPDRLNQLLNSQDQQQQVIEKLVQDVEIQLFTKLQANDILFIDSSHVAKAGSDVVYLLFQVLPRLAPGVIVHFHDIFFPFEYPQTWFAEGRAWNEAYFLRAFLQYNTAFKVLFFNSFLGQHHQLELEQKMPLFLKNTGGSLWLQKNR